MRVGRGGRAAALCAFALASAAFAGPDTGPLTPDQFFARGQPTFVLGTAGDDRADAAIAAQAGMIHDMLFPDAPVVTDASLGPTPTWPERAVVYGGPHVNSLLAKTALPFVFGPEGLRVGERTFAGDEYRVIALVPATKEHPAFVLYAGLGTPGITEINGVRHGPQGVLVIDRFGPLVAGAWTIEADGKPSLRMGKPALRPAWKSTDVGGVTVARVERVPIDAAVAAAQDAAIARGVERSAKALGVKPKPGIVFYVYPDPRSKASVTGNGGDGHADVVSRTLHVKPADPSPGGGLEDLVAHEATHVIAFDEWGACGTPLIGEGIAVWASGKYQGKTLAEWKTQLPATLPSVVDLLGGRFRKLPEPLTYPLAGLLVEWLVETHGLEKVRTMVYGASSLAWADTTKALGTTPDELEAAFRKRLGR